MMKKFITIIIIIITPLLLKAQQYPQNYFASPVNSKILLSGTFAELRTNHFHSGIDIKTQFASDKTLYAVADGYVSRIKVFPDGYGYALYITHPNGYVSVYAHLQKYSKEIQEYVKKRQYELKSFQLDIFPTSNELKITKGSIIGYSGNTGSSFGAHLHFEIRDSKTEMPINPLFFGYDVKDSIRPKIKHLKIYPASSLSLVLVSGSRKAQTYSVKSIMQKLLLLMVLFTLESTLMIY